MAADWDFDPAGIRLPIKINATSNGEVPPRPLNEAERTANNHARDRADDVARATGHTRRTLFKTPSGVATTLLAFNEVHEAFGAAGGRYAIPDEAAFDQDLAARTLGGTEFILDMQTHCVDPANAGVLGREGEVWHGALASVFGTSNGSSANGASGDGSPSYAAQALAKEVFLDSDTDMAVVSVLWDGAGTNGTQSDYVRDAKNILDLIGGRTRGLIHAGVLPNEDGALDRMAAQVGDLKVDAWTIYPQWGPEGVGFAMDDETHGRPFLERAKGLGVKVVCAHRGMPLPYLDYQYSHPGDIARAAKLYPDMTFVCFHSGFEPDLPEGPFDPRADYGINRLISAHWQAGFTPNEGNLYAELGSVWRHVMGRPDEAAHVLGKLLLHFGEDRICWGTDSLWYGSPQDQIQTFRAFEISVGFQERFGYPPLTKEAKAKIFGLNAARIHDLDPIALKRSGRQDTLGATKAEYRVAPNPSFRTLGPKTRHDFLALWEAQGRRPS